MDESGAISLWDARESITLNNPTIIRLLDLILLGVKNSPFIHLLDLNYFLKAFSKIDEAKLLQGDNAVMLRKRISILNT